MPDKRHGEMALELLIDSWNCDGHGNVPTGPEEQASLAEEADLEEGEEEHHQE